MKTCVIVCFALAFLMYTVSADCGDDCKTDCEAKRITCLGESPSFWTRTKCEVEYGSCLTPCVTRCAVDAIKEKVKE